MATKGLVNLTITKIPSTGEYKVMWRNKKYRTLEKPKSVLRLDEAKSYYTDDPEDAFLTMKSMAVEARRDGHPVQIGGTSITRRLVHRYSKSSEIGSEGNSNFFLTSDFSSTGFPLGIVEVKK